jgi:uncharacterized protein YwgA
MSIDIPSLLKAAGGEIVGKVRLQKIVYLLDQMGMNSGYSYEYHHYGPYSAELADSVDEDVVFDEIEEISQRRASDGVPYSVFRISHGASVAAKGEMLGDIPLAKARDALGVMERYSATVLELAATIHWLADVERISDWRTELRRRKGAKADQGRDRQALELLSELGLAPS